jgi:hypothetical protein
MNRNLHMVRSNFYKALLVLVIAILGSAEYVTADKVEIDPFYSKLQNIWNEVRLGRDLQYWRAPESTPGSYLSMEPAATDVWVSCDRWPDGSDARRFGLDAIRLSGAQTDHEKALAVYRWVRRWMIYNNKKGSSIEHLNPSPVGHAVVQQADKLLNVYGVHWCAGQARVVEQIWRALGYRAEKVIRGGHTIVGLHYQDYDGVSRWHGLDVSHSAVAWHDSYRRLLSLDELSTQWYAYFYQYGLPGNGHIYFNDHRMELQLRRGETLERLWGNIGRPYQDNAASGPGMAERVPDSERGPYLPFTYGNGIWSYKPDLRLPGWEKGLAEKPENMHAGRLQPAAALKPAAAIWHFRTPYIISDASVRLVFKRKDASDKIRLHFSADNGRSWAPIWQCPDNLVGMQDMLIPICPKYDVSEKGQPPPPNFYSPFGRYSYRLKLELNAGKSPENFQVSDIAFENTVQLNLYSLPQLHPGINKISVRGRIDPASALRITYTWTDSEGGERRHVALVENAPFTYEIIVDGEKWTDCVCKSIKVEAVDATGKGNSLEHVEDSRRFKQADVLPPVEETTGRWNSQPLRKKLPKLEDVLSATRDPQRFRRMLRGAVMLADPRMFEAFKNLAYQEPSPNDKLLAFVGMYRADFRKARSVLLDILNDREGRRVVWSKGKDSKDIGWGRELSWCEGGTVIGYIAAEAQWPEFLPDLLRVLSSDQCKSGWGPRYGTVRVIGQLGQGNREAADAIRNILEEKHGKEHGDTLVAAALAAGQLADKAAIPSLRRHLGGEYWPLKHNAALALGNLGDTSVVPRMLIWLKAPFDDNFRGYAAEVLGDLQDDATATHLKNALAVEPVPWVRQKIEESLKRIQTVTHNEN